jgi:tetratricopeptide (TPR) repeat protein
MTTRIEQLEQFVKDDPDDPFNIYALALEYQKFDIPKALSLFQQLTNSHAEYVPTYYHLAKVFEATGNTSEALQTLEKGIAVARHAGDHKAARELQSALAELEE